MKRENSINKPKKIRNKLIYYTYSDLKKKIKKENHLLINSMTSNDLNNKYQKCSDYCVKKIETYSSYHNLYNSNNINNNYLHVSVTYCSLNNNYKMLIEKNNNFEKYTGKRNIVLENFEHHYYGEKVIVGNNKIRDKFNYKESMEENNILKKTIIGEKKLRQKIRRVASALDVTQKLNLRNSNIIKKEENKNLKSINNEVNHKKILNEHLSLNNGTIFGGIKIRKKNINKNMAKLKNYCSNLIILKKKVNFKSNVKISSKDVETSSPNIEKKRKSKNNFKSVKNKQKKIGSPISKDSVKHKHKRIESQFVAPKIDKNILLTQANSNYPTPAVSTAPTPTPTSSNLYSRTKNRKMLSKKKTKNLSIDTKEKKHPIKKLYTSNNKCTSSKKLLKSKFRKSKEDQKEEDLNFRKFVSDNKLEYAVDKRKINNNINAQSKQINNNGKVNSLFRPSNNSLNKKRSIEKSSAINKIDTYRAGEKTKKNLILVIE